MIAWLRARLATDAVRWHRLWSVRVAIFWGAFGGALTFVSAIGAELLPPIIFGPLIVLMCVTYAVARVTKQPGLE